MKKTKRIIWFIILAAASTPSGVWKAWRDAWDDAEDM